MTQTEQDHDELVARLKKPGQEVLEALTQYRADLWHGATGVATETGELLDAVKKLVIYNRPLDLENVVEELGDIEFYLAMVRQNLGILRTDTLRANLAKLGKRYAAGYSDKAAQERADKPAGE